MGGLRVGSAGVVAATALGVSLGLMSSLVGLAAPAYADDTVVVQGTAFPDPARANLSLVGCDLYQRSDEQLAPMIGRGPGAAPAGARSLGFDLAGGNAVGALFTVGSVLGTTTASIAVNAVGRASGVAYAGYQEPADRGTSYLWLGRSELTTPGGAWQTVEATTRSYLWTKYDMTTRQPVLAGSGVPTTVALMAAQHGGDGPGVFTIGFGCDGTPFSMDALRVGGPGSVTTYDVEGLRTQVTISAQTDKAVEPGDAVTLTGTLETGTGDPVPHATMLLEQRTAGSDTWKPVLVASVGPQGSVRAEVKPEVRTFYRWRFVDRPLAEGSTSMPLVLDVLPPITSEPPSPSSSPTQEPSGTPSEAPSTPAAPSEAPSSDAPSDSSSPSASASPTESATASATASAAPGETDPSPSDGAAADESVSPRRSTGYGSR
ncbi:hypothetical protein [uncultured Nocardioides sp.]|uniref:hypothetical protein n=1 Tax=uncultured Nocardioides sp. TaxID=198441 RepID=UPI0026398954|nr:hypothetical protein [uncultured Nocardioides sp.]